MKKFYALALVSVLALPGAGVAQVKDLAALFPADTKAYLEINQIDQFVKELRPLLKGSVLEDLPGSLEKIRAKFDEETGYYMRMMELTMILTPEALAEVTRLKGAAVAVTSMPKGPGEYPEIVGVVLTGESNVPGMFLRGMLTMDRYHKVAEVEGIKIYRHRYRQFEEKVQGGPGFEVRPLAKPKYHEVGPAIAIPPGAIVVGSTTESVGNVIKRMKAKANDGLAAAADFKKAAAQRQEPGFFLYAELETLTGLFTLVNQPYSGKAAKSMPPPVPREDFDRKEPVVEAQPKEKPAQTPLGNLIASMKAFKTIAVNLTLKDGALEARGTVSFDTKLPSGWPDFFTRRTVDLNLFQYAPPHTRTVLALPLPDGEQFWNKLGKMAPTFETNISLTLGPGALDKITHMAMIDVAPLDVKDKTHGPVWLLQMKDADSAATLAKELASNLKMPALAKGSAIAVGMHRPQVELVLAAGAAKKGMLSLTKNANVLKGHDKAHLVLAFSPAQSMIDQLKQEAERVRNWTPRKKKFEKFKDFDFEKKVEEVSFQQPTAQPESPQQRYAKHLDRIAAELAKANETLPPIVFSISKKDNHLTMVARQSNIQNAAARLVDGWMEWGMFSSAYGYQFRRFEEMRVNDDPLLIPPPPLPDLPPVK
jgi:hypothetical protein